MDRLPRPGDLYRHYTNKIYQVITVAAHAQTGEQMAVYQAMFGGFGVYAGSLEWFLGEVDREEHPQAAQRYLFEKIEKTGAGKTEIGKAEADKAGTGKLRTEETGIKGTGAEGTGIKASGLDRTGIGEAGTDRTRIEAAGTERIGIEGTDRTRIEGTDRIRIEEAGIKASERDRAKIEGTGIKTAEPERTRTEGTGIEGAGIKGTGVEKAGIGETEIGTSGLMPDGGAKQGGFRPGAAGQSGYQQEWSRRPAFQIAAMGQEAGQPGSPAEGKQREEKQRDRKLPRRDFQPEQDVAASGRELRPRIQSPAESRRVLRQEMETSGRDSYYQEKRRRQIEEREQRRGMFRKPQKHESATEELRANPCLLKFLDADTYEQKFQVLGEIQDDITDRLVDDIAVVLDVVIPEGPLDDRYRQLRNIILTRQKYETDRFR